MTEYFETFNIAFLHCGEVGPEKELRGAVLVTDKKSHPLELRFTDAVKATTPEKLVYGVTLKRGIAIEKLALPLIKALETPCNLIVVNDPALLDLAKASSTPVCCFRELDGEIEIETIGNDKERNQRLTEVLVENLDADFDWPEPIERLEKVLEHIQYYGNIDTLSGI